MTRNEFGTFFQWGCSILLLIFALSAVAYGLGWIGSAADVAKDEFGPAAALKKYEWFIDQKNAIGKADQDIVLFEKKRADVDIQYVATYGADRSRWLPSSQVQYNQAAATARDDLLAVVSNRNGLVKEYNEQSEKFNWAPFQTRPDLPPRTFFNYVVK
ncbi:hypothetical protein HY086_04170 [Candidatus Gottesmanbacteria bacterium]|nr:hypothetical protein [Candidatus Gottesmanbacteria bacterium]